MDTDQIMHGRSDHPRFLPQERIAAPKLSRKFAAGVSIDRALRVLNIFFQHRRASYPKNACSINCEMCARSHLEKISAAMNRNETIRFVLPAFPGKSPNRNKVISHLPDLGERLALRFLNSLCEKVREIHAPGAEMMICSDGRVFSDVVGMDERHVSEYQQALESIVAQESLANISFFNLDQFYDESDFALARLELLRQFGEDTETLRNKIREGASFDANTTERDLHHLYLGMTRFLVEDAMHPGRQKSRTAVQKECRLKAIELIRKSNAWTALIASQFPEAVRLSIHPQGCNPHKLGIRLIGQEVWLTPWHAVALELEKGSFTLIKKFEAESRGAELVLDATGNPSHYRISSVLGHACGEK